MTAENYGNFEAAANELIAEVEALILKVSALNAVGETYSVAGAVEDARQYAAQAQAALDAILLHDSTAASDAAAAANSATMTAADLAAVQTAASQVSAALASVLAAAEQSAADRQAAQTAATGAAASASAAAADRAEVTDLAGDVRFSLAQANQILLDVATAKQGVDAAAAEVLAARGDMTEAKTNSALAVQKINAFEAEFSAARSKLIRTISTSAPSGIPREGEEWIIV